jgi:hypothetical protein
MTRQEDTPAPQAESAPPLQSLIEAQVRRIDRLWTRFEETGDERWMCAAQDADRMYRRMRERTR